MNLTGFKSNGDGVTGLCSVGRSNASVDVLTFAYHVKVGFSTHKLGNFNVSGNYTVRILLNEFFLVVNVLGTDTHNNFLTNVIVELAVSILGCGQLNLILNTCTGLGVFRTELYIEIVAFLKKNGIDKVHLGRTDKACNEEVARIEVKGLRSVSVSVLLSVVLSFVSPRYSFLTNLFPTSTLSFVHR